MVVLDDQPGDASVDDPDASRLELCGLGRRRLLGVGDVDDVLGPLADELGVEDGTRVGAEHGEGLIANLPAVAIGTVQEVLSPSLTDAGDVRELVARSGGYEDAAGRELCAVAEADGEAGVDAHHDVVDDLDAVAGDLGSPCREQVAGWHAVAGEVALHMSGRGVSR